MSTLTITKKYIDFPAGHRQPNHDGHCKFLHGHDWAFEFTFSAAKLDENGFIIDFGKLQFVKQFLTNWFDHTFLIANSDPEMALFEELSRKGFIQLRHMESVSVEGIAKFVFHSITAMLADAGYPQAQLTKVTVWEDSKNSCTYTT